MQSQPGVKASTAHEAAIHLGSWLAHKGRPSSGLGAVVLATCEACLESQRTTDALRSLVGRLKQEQDAHDQGVMDYHPLGLCSNHWVELQGAKDAIARAEDAEGEYDDEDEEPKDSSPDTDASPANEPTS